MMEMQQELLHMLPNFVVCTTKPKNLLASTSPRITFTSISKFQELLLPATARRSIKR